ncbi:MAG: peptidoglycan-binding protein [Candidatus Pacebacteria bacterium]|nr:peptidoglycan-binding protein [Candidatus Paceibacterota bacterium]
MAKLLVKKIVVLLLFVVLGFSASSALAVYNDVQYTAGDNVIIYLSGEALNLTVISGNVASTTVNASNVVFRMVPSSTISLTSSNRKIMSNSLGINTVCTNSESQIYLQATSTTLADITVTIGGDCPAVNTGGETQSPVVTITTPVTSTTSSQEATTTTTTETVTPTTTAQATTTITVPAVTSSTSSGQAKPISEMTVSELQAEITRITALISQLTASIGGGTTETASKITKVLKMGMKDTEVTLLQTWLAKDATVYPEAKITGYFGPLTFGAVVKFQEKYASDILTPLGLSSGTGLVGASTRAKLNSLFAP